MLASVCATISNVPGCGLDCPIILSLSAAPGNNKSGNFRLKLMLYMKPVIATIEDCMYVCIIIRRSKRITLSCHQFPSYVFNVCFSPYPATNGMDYSLPGDFQIEFGSSSLSGDAECVNVTISNDDFVEGKEEFVVTVTSVSPQVELSVINSVTVTIVDNDCKIIYIVIVSI